MKKILYIVLLATGVISAQIGDVTVKELNIPSVKITVNGTLIMPNKVIKPKLVIIIPGSGPTDRNGNQGQLQTNATKYLAEALGTKGIASYRYDKSAIALSKQKDFKEENVTFDAFITDAKAVVSYFKKDDRFSKIVVAGHSQGSLVGMEVANFADAYISLDGAGRPIDQILIEQISTQAPFLEKDTKTILDSLKQGHLVKNVPSVLVSLFRPSVQPFMINWMRYNPQKEIKKIKVPILIINGTKDIQVPVKDADLLYNANPKSQLAIIDNMNHIFKEIKGDVTENRQSYTNPKLPVMSSLVKTIVDFINKI